MMCIAARVTHLFDDRLRISCLEEEKLRRQTGLRHDLSAICAGLKSDEELDALESGDVDQPEVRDPKLGDHHQRQK